MIDDMLKWKHLVIDVIIADDQKTIEAVFADSKRVFSNLTEEDLAAYIKRLGDEGWEFVHLHTRDQLYRVYYFKRRKEQIEPTQGDASALEQHGEVP